MVRTINDRFKGLYRHRRLISDMVRGQIKSKYAGSRLGIWWAVITPVLLAVCINIIFTKAFRVKTPNYAFFVLSGIRPWFFFATALTEAANSFIVGSNILKQGVFPKEIVPISSVLGNLVNFIIGLAFLLPVFAVVNIKVAALLPVLALIIILQFVFITGLGLFLSCLNVFMRDVVHFLSIGLMIWFWITPIFYSADMLGYPYRYLCVFNPMTYYIASYKDILFRAELPSLFNVVLSFLISTVSFFAGYIFFVRKEPSLLKRI